MTRHTLSLLVAAVLTAPLHAQVFTMLDAAVSSCTGSILDSGGEGASGYGNNENFTTTVCSNNAGGPAISLQFITFNLSTAGSAPNDVLFIYDGPDTSSPLIGQWSGSDTPGIVSASSANASGCLTLVFTSNETGTGVFSSLISCFTPCQPPVAVATVDEGLPALVCLGEVLTFNGAGSSGSPGSSIVDYAWDFGDGTTDDSGPLVQHSYTEPGEYMAQLTVTDNNGCISTNTVDLLVGVSGAPSFQGTSAPSAACVGATVPLVAQVAPASDGFGVYSTSTNSHIPDGQGDPLVSAIEVTGHAPGALVGSIDEVPTVCVDLEHSFMGDLVIYLVCPNGQSVTFHQQGGGGTFLGGALDGETDPPTAGTCWNYCWSASATNGTWFENSSGTLPSGTYESVQPMEQLIGCPLDGTWSLTVVDQWSIDDGWLCAWGLDLDPAANGPVPGTSSLDSAFWSGPGVITNPATPLVAQATVTTPGVQAYTFTVTDNYGCTYDTTVTVTAPDVVLQGIDGPTVISGPDAVVYTAQGVGADVEAIQWTLPAGWSWAADPDILDATALVLPAFTPSTFQLCATAQGMGCASATFCLQGDVFIGMEDAARDDVSRVFPNPTTGVVQVVRPSATPALLTVVDALGRTVHQHPMNSPHTVLDLGPLGAGAYVLLWWEGAQLHRHPVTVVR